MEQTTVASQMEQSLSPSKDGHGLETATLPLIAIPSIPEVNNTTSQEVLTFPEIEEVISKDGQIITRQGSGETVRAQARKNFKGAAYRVLNQIMKKPSAEEDSQGNLDSSRTTDVIPEEQDESENQALTTEKKKGQSQTNNSPGRSSEVLSSRDTTPRRASVGGSKLSRTGSQRMLHKRHSLSTDSLASSSVETESTDTPQLSDRRQSKAGGSFMSLVRMAALKNKMSTGGKRRGSVSSSSAIEQHMREELSPYELPNQVRFGATLSLEAQYAMFKCYEDVLLNNLNLTHQERGTTGVLYRVKTPHQSVRSLRLAKRVFNRSQILSNISEVNNSKTKISLETASEPNLQSVQSNSETSMRDSKVEREGVNESGTREVDECAKEVEEGTKEVNENPKEDTGSSKESQRSSRIGHRSSRDGSMRPASGSTRVPKERQLRMTHKFQTAMDILDTLRNSQGQLILSPRFPRENTKAHINPVRHYNVWSKSWCKEFQFEMPTAVTNN